MLLTILESFQQILYHSIYGAHESIVMYSMLKEIENILEKKNNLSMKQYNIVQRGKIMEHYLGLWLNEIWSTTVSDAIYYSFMIGLVIVLTKKTKKIHAALTETKIF